VAVSAGWPSGADIAGVRLPGTGAEVRFTGRAEGDMSDPTLSDSQMAARREVVVRGPWTCLRQVHGARVVFADRVGGSDGAVADAVVTAMPRVPIAVLSADCAPVALASPEGVIGAAHAGWRGLLAGVVEETVAAMRRAGATEVVAALGPCIHAECYRFGAGDLAVLVERYGRGVSGRDRGGAPAFDLPAAVKVALDRCGAFVVHESGVCTACSPDHWSWRARGDTARQAMVVWRP
jgi:YfiH family protein